MSATVSRSLVIARDSSPTSGGKRLVRAASQHANVLRTNVPRAVRFLRRRRRLRQEDLAAESSVSRERISRLERGELDSLTVGTISRIAEGLGASLNLELRWHGEQLDRLMDETHAALQQRVATLLADIGWLVRLEVSFNRYGDRGRCDILAFHPLRRVLLVVEIKSRLGDLQETLGRLDVKARLGPVLAREVAWPSPALVVPALVLAEHRTTRRLVAAHDALFARLDRRGPAARAWLRRPSGSTSGLLWFQSLPDSHSMPGKCGKRVRSRTPAHQV